MNHSFPKDFVWGTATSSYQIEGAAKLEGKGPSIWDAFSEIPGKVSGGDNGRIACDHYHRMEEDVQLMKELGVDAYRFSVSWPRILPLGKKDQVNQAGLDWYNHLIDTLLKYNITPWVTLYHWDLPLALQLEEDGWLNPEIADYFADYAEVCFAAFADRVKHWITINEPWVISILGYGQGTFAPGRVSTTEPYIVGHNILRAHAKAVHRFRSMFQEKHGGLIGITNNCDWREPASTKQQDKDAAQRALEFFLAWFADPIYKGQYPETMINRLGERLPKFTTEEKEMLLGSSDFFGLNHYTTMYASEAEGQAVVLDVYGNGGLSEDQDLNLTVDPNWPLTDMKWAVVPWGCRKLLEWIADRYDNPPIYITENGCAYATGPEGGVVDDKERVQYFTGYLEACGQAIENGVNLKGYFIWSLLDNFEWAEGYSKRFGIHYVDFETQERIPKNSAKWYAQFIKKVKGV